MSDSTKTAVGFRSERGPILISLMVATGLIAIDATILATAVPTIVADLGGFSQFPWLFSIYLLAQAVTVPVYSKLSDTFGRKPMIVIGISLFLLGSVLCGLAWDMPALIVGRAIQGLGAGAILPMAVTIAGDIYTVAERARTQAYFASVWAVASVVGPTLGGVFATFDWRWIFWVNIPLGLIAGWLIIRDFHEVVEKRPHKIDYAGAILLTTSLTLIILGVLEGGQAWEWGSPISVGIFVGGGLLLVAALLVERRAAEPILPFWPFRRRLLLSTNLMSLAIGAVLIGLTSYVPTYLSGSIGTPPLVAGAALAALTLGWPISAAISGRVFYLRYGFKRTALIGLGFVIVGASVLVAFAATPSVLVVAISSFIIGFGMGLVATPVLIAAQSSVEWDERGVVTGLNLFARSIGSAVGVAVFGAIANGIIASSGGENEPQAIIAGSTAVFVASLIVAVLCVAAALAMPRDRPERVSSDVVDNDAAVTE